MLLNIATKGSGNNIYRKECTPSVGTAEKSASNMLLNESRELILHTLPGISLVKLSCMHHRTIHTICVCIHKETVIVMMSTFMFSSFKVVLHQYYLISLFIYMCNIAGCADFMQFCCRICLGYMQGGMYMHVHELSCICQVCKIVFSVFSVCVSCVVGRWCTWVVGVNASL